MRTLIGALALALCATALPAQQEDESQAEIQELVRQIRRNMRQVEADLNGLEAEAAKTAGEQVKNDIDRLIESTRAAGEQVTSDIDAVISKMRSCNSGGGGGQSSQSDQKSQSQQNQSQARDRNKQDQAGQKPKPGEQAKNEPQGGPKEDNSRKDPQGGKNRSGNRRENPEAVKAVQQKLMQRWGVLPPELRQQLVDRNFKDFTPEYEAEIKAYFRRIQQNR